jgi:putative transposase
MADLTIKQRMLPHWELAGATYFVTFNTWERMVLIPEARQIVLEACLFFANQRYRLFSLVVMPDHVHLLLQPLPRSSGKYWTLSSIMHSIKSYSAKQIPKVMTHLGTVWQPERFDRIVRSPREFANVCEYIRQNPVKANLSESPDQYPFLWNPPS